MWKPLFFGCFFVLLCSSVQLNAQDKQLQSGPMVGYSEMTEVLLWAQTTESALVKFSLTPQGSAGQRVVSREVRTKEEEAFIARIPVGDLVPGTSYTYELYINGKQVKRDYPFRCQTQKLWQWREDPPSFSIAVGSCLYVNETEHDRPGTPYGSEMEIMMTMAGMKPDAMLWLGDNTYLREVDWYSRSGIFHRYTHTRSLPELQPFLGSVHQYATWDDHDYGPNNSDRSFRNKEDALDAFKLFWGNPTHGTADMRGVMTMFQWGDVDFFLLDNRYHRSPERGGGAERTMLGEAQFNWLIDNLNSSNAPFKIVAFGGQVLNAYQGYENFSTFPAERERLLTRLEQDDIRGVVFLSGDRHHTELSKLDRRGAYPLYDITVSPLTAGTGRQAESEANYLRVENTFVGGEHTFGILGFSGPRRERVLTVAVYNAGGEQKWAHTIEAAKLK